MTDSAPSSVPHPDTAARPEPARALASLCHEIHLLDSSADLLAWDQEVMMPPAGLERRAEQLELLARLRHERLVSSAFGDALAAAEEAGENLGDDGWIANVRELRRQREHALALPADLVARSAKTHSHAQAAWSEARRTKDFGQFSPWLAAVFDLARERARALRAAVGDRRGWREDWDALADGFEPGITAVQLEELFARITPPLSALVERVSERPEPDGAELRRTPIGLDRQEEFVRSIAFALGFDGTRGRIDRSTHPFCSGTHPNDVRLTTRFLEHDVLDGLGSTMHETGHALYEQGLPAHYAGTPSGQAPSLGLHESQSRLWENHVGRGRAFWTWAHPRALETIGAPFDRFDADAVFRAANRVVPSLIRVEADEVTYDLHVALRFELERALLRGDLTVDDLPGAWNEGMTGRFAGIAVPDNAQGCLQDVHWSCGLVGYFPTYTLGNVYAAELFGQAERDITGLDEAIAHGEFTVLREWLRDRVHRHGSRKTARELVADVLGRDPEPDAMLAHLERRVTAVYG